MPVTETTAGFVAEEEATLARRHFNEGAIGLLRCGDGSCRAWQNLTQAVYANQGIQTQAAKVTTSGHFQVNATLPGQGGIPKESIWKDHAVIRYGDDIYDPSYGLHYGQGDDAKQAFVDQVTLMWVPFDSH